jgi:ketosteroid isomerase-like protein
MKTQNVICGRTIIGLLALLLVVIAGRTALAQATVAHKDGGPGARKNDEQALRELLRLESEGKNVIKFTDQSIIASGAYPHPVIGPEARKQANEELSRKRLNQKRNNEIARLVVSESGDMAYEYGNFTMSFDTPEKKSVSFNGVYLRVWRKVGGEWMAEIVFARPTEPVTEKPSNQSR